MKTAPESNDQVIDFPGDPRWELAQRVIKSPPLIGSARLRDFLLHVAACAIHQTPEEATEQQIGIQVFQRSPGFNSSEDSIVRSQARLLRLKLSAYFNAEGASEPLIIEIPKGHYLPVFLPSKKAKDATERPAEASVKLTLTPVHVEGVNDVLPPGLIQGARTERQRCWLTVAGIGLAFVLCLPLAIDVRWDKQ